MAAVAQGGATLRVVCGRRHEWVVVVFESRRAGEPDATLPTRGQFAPLVVLDVHHAKDRAPHGARLVQPTRAVGDRQADALRACVVLVPDGAPPIDHLPLDGRWTRR